MNGQLALFAPLAPPPPSDAAAYSSEPIAQHVVNGQITLFAPLAPSVAGIDPSKASASYSADIIAMTGKIRKPVAYGGYLWVSTGSCGTASRRIRDMYRVVPIAEFDGEVTTYTEKTSVWLDGDKYPGDYARNDPNGFYHGMKVQNGGSSYVLCGPEQTIEINDLVELLDTTDDEEYDDVEWDEDEDEDDELEVRAAAAAESRLSKTLCTCGHEEFHHDTTGDHRGCYWSEGTGKQYRDCDCNNFDPA